MSTDHAKKLCKFEEENSEIPIRSPFEVVKEREQLRQRKLQQRAMQTAKKLEPSALVKKMQEER